MLFLLDTNAVSDYMQGLPRIGARLDGIAESDDAAVCTIVRGEILFGIDRLPQGKRRERLRQRAAEVMSVLECLAVPEAAGDVYATIKIDTIRKGFTLSDNDLWIAATAIATGATLVTRDKDLSQIDGLSVQDWSV